MARSNRWVVVKFGGTSVNSAKAWLRVHHIVQQHLSQQRRVLLVCSAPRGISDQLSDLFDAASQGRDFKSILNQIHQCFNDLSMVLNLTLPVCFEHSWQQLNAYLSGINLLQEASAKYRAQLMSYGELLLTQIGQQYLLQQQLDCECLMATEYLTSYATDESAINHYLDAQCVVEPNSRIIEKLNAKPSLVFITQGFVASNTNHETVLLGRGGSDISAAYFSVLLSAELCEIWTDVPGIYTANPHHFSSARHITHLSYDEAQEIALMGAHVLHPETIQPLRQHSIPLLIGYTNKPTRPGTRVSHASSPVPVIKSVNIKRDVTLISLDALGMWQRSGFLADVFACFKQHHISVDLITTAESNITVSLDTKMGLVDQQRFAELRADLAQFASVKVISPCANVSVVGSQIKRVLYQIKELFALFRSSSIHLISQSSNDMSFTVVVDQDQVDSYAQLLHDIVIEHSIAQDCFGMSYQQEFVEQQQPIESWWKTKQAQVMQLTHQASPAYVYDKNKLAQQAQQLLHCKAIDQVFYALKANTHPEILQQFYCMGLGFECVSIYEVDSVFQCFPNIDPKRILFTPNFASREEYQQALMRQVHVTIDNLHPLIEWSDLFKDQPILIRIDPGYGEGHHEFVETGGNQSKFGLSKAAVDQLEQVLEQCQARVIGLHAHSGSGILQVNNWARLAHHLVTIARRFPSVKIINLGGGLGVPERLGYPDFDVVALNDQLQAIRQEYPQYQFWLEPGRFLTAESGVLCARVTQIKQKASLTYIGIDAGMHNLIRPALYGSYHDIINLSRMDQPIAYLAHIVGPICESGDVIGRSRWMPETFEGDTILIATAGAYGASMSSRYNLRPLANEFFIEPA